MRKISLINSHTVFIATLVVAATIGLIVYFVGLQDHSSLYHNTLLTTSILTAVFFIFVFVGLYRGWKMKDTLGDMTAHFSKLPKPKSKGDKWSRLEGIQILELGEGCEEFFAVLILWVVVALFGTLILWFIGAFFWGLVLILAGLLYWIIFRAYRLIFKNSAACKGNIFESFRIALLYSVLYTCWIYAIIYGVHYFK